MTDYLLITWLIIDDLANRMTRSMIIQDQRPNEAVYPPPPHIVWVTKYILMETTSNSNCATVPESHSARLLNEEYINER